MPRPRSVAGMVPAGESYDEAALRECSEEIGATGVRLTRVGKYRYDHPLVPQWTVLYEAVVTGPVVPQESEVEWFDFLSDDQVRATLHDDAWTYCPDSLFAYRMFYLDGQE